MKTILLSLLLTCIVFPGYAQQPTIELWPETVPGQEKPKKEAVISGNNDRNVTRIAEVTNPLLKVFAPDQPNGAAVIVCPGGGYNILAIDLEGYEIAEWLRKMGFTAFVLQYRVPEKQEGALQDVQRAIRLVRQQAHQWDLNPEKLGVMGFSAGGSLSARASTRYDDRTYDNIDLADQLSARPDFSLLIYPAYLDQGPDRSLTPELPVTGETPPAFLFATADDDHGNSTLVYTKALRDNEVPVEMHMLAEGGHGYGLREGNVAGETWPELAETWLQKIIKDQ